MVKNHQKPMLQKIQWLFAKTDTSIMCGAHLGRKHEKLSIFQQ